MKTQPNNVVIGLGFGDEGKGRVVSELCRIFNPELTFRFSGGHQAAHKVEFEDGECHTFSNFGSGTLNGTSTYFMKYCTVDPIGIMNELDFLIKKKRFYSEGVKLYIDPKCPVTTPWDKVANLKDKETVSHGSCGVGFGQTWEREENHYSLLAEDLLNQTTLGIKLDLISKYYNNQSRILLDSFTKCCKSLVSSKYIKIKRKDTYKDIVYEGSQGLLLDQDIGFFPHVTRSNTGTQNIIKHLNLYTDNLYLVTRAYQTRHGNGPMTFEGIESFENPYEDQISDGSQGDFRSSILDIDLLKYSISKEPNIKKFRNIDLVITCLDVVKDNWLLAVDGRIIPFNNERAFINFISTELDIQDIHLSYNPFGEFIKFK